MEIKAWNPDKIEPASGPFVVPGVLEASTEQWKRDRITEAVKKSIVTNAGSTFAFRPQTA